MKKQNKKNNNKKTPRHKAKNMEGVSSELIIIIKSKQFTLLRLFTYLLIFEHTY